MANLALSVVSNALFGVSTADKGDLVEAVRSFELTLRERLEGIPWTGWDPGLGRDRLQHSVRRAHHELTLNIAARRERGDPGADLLGRLLTAMEGDHPLEEAELLDHCVTLFFAGHGTTSRALAWTLAVLARHPDWWDRAAAEASGKSAPEAPTVPSRCSIASSSSRCGSTRPPGCSTVRSSSRCDSATTRSRSVPPCSAAPS
jgi:cytochrome P450